VRPGRVVFCGFWNDALSLSPPPRYALDQYFLRVFFCLTVRGRSQIPFFPDPVKACIHVFSPFFTSLSSGTITVFPSRESPLRSRKSTFSASVSYKAIFSCAHGKRSCSSLISAFPLPADVWASESFLFPPPALMTPLAIPQIGEDTQHKSTGVFSAGCHHLLFFHVYVPSQLSDAFCIVPPLLRAPRLFPCCFRFHSAGECPPPGSHRKSRVSLSVKASSFLLFTNTLTPSPASFSPFFQERIRFSIMPPCPRRLIHPPFFSVFFHPPSILLLSLPPLSRARIAPC